MRRINLTLLVMCATLLWAGAVMAQPFPGGLPQCETTLTQSNQDLATCNSELSVAQLCGNGQIDADEQCDQGNLNSQTCASQGFVGGTLKCGANCQFDTSSCTNTRFVDNGDGTVTDNKTGLMWEQTVGTVGGTNTGDINDVNNTYTWSSSSTAPAASSRAGA